MLIYILQIINKWRNKSAEALSSVDCQQLMSCLEIGKWCIKSERNERPTTGQIIKKLSLESIDCSLDSQGAHRKKQKKVVTRLLKTRYYDFKESINLLDATDTPNVGCL